MRLISLTVLSLSALLFTAGCGDDDSGGEGEGFATLQECFTDHHEEEALTVEQAIVVCCLDHPIDGQTEVCGDTAAACVTFVSAELDDASATPAEIDESCTSYITERGL